MSAASCVSRGSGWFALLRWGDCPGPGHALKVEGSMKPYWFPSSRAFSFVGIQSRRFARAAALVLSLTSIPLLAGSASAATSASAASSAHVYLLRGVLNIFSFGLDDIAEKLRAQGITVTVANFISWSSLANEAASEYRSGRIKTIVLVGHSSGATALPDMVARLDSLGTPVKLAIGLDSVFRTSLSGRVGRYINFYVANGNGEPVARTKQLRGGLENIDVGKLGMAHLTIDKSEIMQRRVIAAINAAAVSHPKPPPVPQQVDASAASQSPPGADASTAARR